MLGHELEKTMINPLFDRNKVNLVIQSALDGYSARHRAIVNNIANVDTPGYQRVEIRFEERLKSALKASSAEGIVSGDGVESSSLFETLKHLSPTARTDFSTPVRADGSNVSIDREMAELAKNGGRMNALTELLIRNYRDLKTAVLGR
ncbi:MAG: hypothetical protein AMXMBFR75_23540 [Candidatus Hinthialibacteria bacterium]|nr:MAG: Flagellar basal body rod protein FlgB [Candidatus Hinthialibacteria bacterium OLB16]MBV6481045.1 Flagellar basal body rod protein FlgB [bacterium]MCE7909029.1 flagellar basal body rod protein FlgB [Candidatus Omnitrophica bacterium COP1]